MATENGTTVEEKPKPRRGPRKESDIRADLEAKIRAEFEAKYEGREADLESSQESPTKVATGTLVVHFLEDGFTVFGKVWYRGEELALEPDSDNWNSSLLPDGRNLFQLTEQEQIAKWGKWFFREGRWQGKRLTEIEDEELTEADRIQLAKAEQIREERFGKV